jgi:hypothetical protein
MTELRIVRSGGERVEEALRFLRHLYPADDLAERGAKLVLWRPKRTPDFLDDLAAVAERAVAYADSGEDCYFSVCAMRSDFEPPKEKRGARGTAADLRLAAALWVDLDVKSGSFDSRDAALAFLDGLPLLPSARVNSGEGVHAYWALREPVEFASAAEIAEFDALSRGWLEYLRQRAVGAKIDPVSDLARVMRLPGTIRYKGGAGLPVSLIALDDARRYNPTDFREHAVAVFSRAPTSGSGYILDPDAYPPNDLFSALLANDMERFGASWARVARKDLKDNSASGHDMSLAAIAVRAGWADQVIIDLLVAARRSHRDEPQNLNYYTYTVLKARASYIEEETVRLTQERTAEFITRIAEAEAAPVGSEMRRHAAVEAARKITGLEIVGIIRYVKAPYSYAIELADGSCYKIGSVTEFMKWDAWIQAAINLNFKINTSRPKPMSVWLSCVQLLSEFARNEEQSDFSTIERTEAMIAAYLSGFGDSVACDSATERAQRAFRRAPYIEDGYLFLSGKDLVTWHERTGRGGRREFSYADLRDLGFVGWTVRALGPRKKIAGTQKYQRAPLDRLPDIQATYGREDAESEGGGE